MTMRKQVQVWMNESCEGLVGAYTNMVVHFTVLQHCHFEPVKTVRFSSAGYKVLRKLPLLISSSTP